MVQNSGISESAAHSVSHDLQGSGLLDLLSSLPLLLLLCLLLLQLAGELLVMMCMDIKTRLEGNFSSGNTDRLQVALVLGQECLAFATELSEKLFHILKTAIV